MDFSMTPDIIWSDHHTSISRKLNWRKYEFWVRTVFLCVRVSVHLCMCCGWNNVANNLFFVPPPHYNSGVHHLSLKFKNVQWDSRSQGPHSILGYRLWSAENTSGTWKVIPMPSTEYSCTCFHKVAPLTLNLLPSSNDCFAQHKFLELSQLRH